MDKQYLQQILEVSLCPDELMRVMGVSKNSDGVSDFGAFDGLNENCRISLELSNFNPEKVTEMLNAYKFPATTVEGADDVTKILVTSTGLQFPLRTPEEAVAELSDVLGVLQANGINTKGYAHPIVAANMTKSEFMPSANEPIIPAIRDDDETLKILECRQTTFDDFVSKKLNEALRGADPYEKAKLAGKYGVSLLRGGTLGDNPYAIVAAHENKDTVYASPYFKYADYYVKGEHIGYEAIDGNTYGFLYEYEMAEDQKFYSDFGIEDGASKGNLQDFRGTGEEAYETNIYPYKNKVKGIYVAVNDKYYKIADEKGFISKDWEDFAKLHTPHKRFKTMPECARNDEIYRMALAKESVPYQAKSYVTSGSLNDYIASQMAESAYQTAENGSFVTAYSMLFREISNGTDLSRLTSVDLSSNVKIGENVRLPERVFWRGDVPDGTDLSTAQYLSVAEASFISKNTKFPSHVILSDCSLDGSDLHTIGNLELKNISKLSADCHLPKQVSVSGKIADGTDLSSCETLGLSGAVEFGKDVKLPKNIVFADDCVVSGHIPEQVKFLQDTNSGEKVTPPLQTEIVDVHSENGERNEKIKETDKDIIAVLSGRKPGVKPYNAITETESQGAESLISTAQRQSEKQENTASSEVILTPNPKNLQLLEQMTQQEKGEFFHKLRLGENTILAKLDNNLSTISEKQSETPKVRQESLHVVSQYKNNERG